MANLAPGGPAGWRGFQELLLPRRSEILGYLDRLKELQAIVRARPREMVVCHTDLHGANLLVDSRGNLYILDWEGAMLAPPEQDLFFFAGRDTFWDLFWPNYEREFGPAQLDVDTLGFYYYRRGLEDLAEWIQRLLYADQGDEQECSALHWATETVAELSKVEPTLGKIAAHLLHR
ncbi:MAG: phosphotransferase [Bacillota bacterium]|nr:phosphotransferase [Bacillota bacterium]